MGRPTWNLLVCSKYQLWNASLRTLHWKSTQMFGGFRQTASLRSSTKSHCCYLYRSSQMEARSSSLLAKRTTRSGYQSAVTTTESSWERSNTFTVQETTVMRSNSLHQRSSVLMKFNSSHTFNAANCHAPQKVSGTADCAQLLLPLIAYRWQVALLLSPWLRLDQVSGTSSHYF